MGHRFELGVRLLRAGQIDEAIRELQAARSDPRHQWRSLLYLGHCFKSRNNWRLAQRNFEEALQQPAAGEDATRRSCSSSWPRAARDGGRPGPGGRTWPTSWPTSTSATATSAGCSTSGRPASIKPTCPANRPHAAQETIENRRQARIVTLSLHR